MRNELFDKKVDADKQTVLSVIAGLPRVTVMVLMFKNESQDWEAVGYSSVDPHKYIETLVYD